MEEVKIRKREDGKFQADVYLTDGRDFHAKAPTPWGALIELGRYWEAQGHMSQNEELARAMLGADVGASAQDGRHTRPTTADNDPV